MENRPAPLTFRWFPVLMGALFPHVLHMSTYQGWDDVKAQCWFLNRKLRLWKGAGTLTTRSECLTPCAGSPFPTRCQVQWRYLTQEGYPELPTERSLHIEAAVALTRVRIYTQSTFCHQSLILPPLSPRPPCHSLPLLIIWLTPLTLRLSSLLYPLLPDFMCLQLCARQIPKDCLCWPPCLVTPWKLLSLLK